MDKAQEKIAENLYGIVADHLAQFIDEFNVDARKPLPWNEITDGKKAFWQKEAEKLGYRKIEGEPPLLSVVKTVEVYMASEGSFAADDPLRFGRAVAQAQRDSDIKWIRGL